MRDDVMFMSVYKSWIWYFACGCAVAGNLIFAIRKSSHMRYRIKLLSVPWWFFRRIWRVLGVLKLVAPEC